MVIGSAYVSGSVSSIVPNVIHQRGEVLQALRDVVRKKKDAHCLQVHRHRESER